MTTLFDVTLAVARKLGVLRTGTVDSGSTTTCVDALRTEVSNHYNGGTLFVTDTTDDAAPKSEYARVSAFASGTITHDELTATLAAGDKYGVMTSRFPLDIILSAINDELINYKAPRYDATSLDVVTAQKEYTLPAGIDKYNLLNVYEETQDDADDPRYVPLDFEVRPAAAGSQHTLVIQSTMITTGNDFLLEYMSWCIPLAEASDTIDESIPLPRLVVIAAAQTVLTVMNTFASGNKLEMEHWKQLTSQAEEAKKRYPIRPTQRRGRVMEAGGTPNQISTNITSTS